MMTMVTRHGAGFALLTTRHFNAMIRGHPIPMSTPLTSSSDHHGPQGSSTL